MARYTGPRLRIARRLGIDLRGLTRKSRERRPYPPGQHGTERRRRSSEYGRQLIEKQKIRFYYGLREQQLRNYVRRVARRPGPTGTNLLVTLERRLDNVVFRLGLAPTIPAARQLIGHGHVRVNGHRLSVPGYQVRVGDEIRVAETARDHPLVVEGMATGPALPLPPYLERSEDGLGGRMIAPISRDEVGVDVNEALVVEYYAR